MIIRKRWRIFVKCLKECVSFSKESAERFSQKSRMLFKYWLMADKRKRGTGKSGLGSVGPQKQRQWYIFRFSRTTLCQGLWTDGGHPYRQAYRPPTSQPSLESIMIYKKDMFSWHAGWGLLRRFKEPTMIITFVSLILGSKKTIFKNIVWLSSKTHVYIL